MIMIYVPVGSEEEAGRIGRTLIEERLVACANLIPISSLYRWEGELQDDRELSRDQRGESALIITVARSRTQRPRRQKH